MGRRRVKGRDGITYVLEPGADLEGADLRGLDLSKANLTGANMVDAVLRDANLENTNLSKADLENANFRNANIKGTIFKGANVEDANFKNVDIDTETNFEGVFNLEKAINLITSGIDKMMKTKTSRRSFFGVLPKVAAAGKAELKKYPVVNGYEIRPGADLSNADLRRSDLSNMDLRGIKFYKANLAGCNLKNSNFAGCNMDYANLSSTDLTRTNFEGCNLAAARFDGADIDHTIFKRAKMQGSTFRKQKIKNTNFRHARLGSAEFDDVNINKCYFDDAQMHSVRFQESSILNSDFINSYMEFAGINAYIEGCNFTKADLSYSSTIEDLGVTEIIFSNFTGADLEGCEWREVEMGRCKFDNTNIQEFKLLYSKIHDTTFKNCKGRGFRPYDTKMKDCTFIGKFDGIRSHGTTYEYSTFKNVEFYDLDFRNDNFKKCDFEKARFVKSHIKWTDFIECNLNIPEARVSLYNVTILDPTKISKEFRKAYKDQLGSPKRREYVVKR